MNNKKQTAVQWLKERLPSLFSNDDNSFYSQLFEQALQMEREQIVEAFYQCGKDNFEHIKVINRSAKEYYNETYGDHLPDVRKTIGGQDESKQ